MELAKTFMQSVLWNKMAYKIISWCFDIYWDDSIEVNKVSQNKTCPWLLDETKRIIWQTKCNILKFWWWMWGMVI